MSTVQASTFDRCIEQITREKKAMDIDKEREDRDLVFFISIGAQYSNPTFLTSQKCNDNWCGLVGSGIFFIAAQNLP